MRLLKPRELAIWLALTIGQVGPLSADVLPDPLPFETGRPLAEVEAHFIHRGFRHTVYRPSHPNIEPMGERHQVLRHKKLRLELGPERQIYAAAGFIVSLTNGIGTIDIHAIGTPPRKPIVYWILYRQRFSGKINRLELAAHLKSWIPQAQPLCEEFTQTDIRATWEYDPNVVQVPRMEGCHAPIAEHAVTPEMISDLPLRYIGYSLERPGNTGAYTMAFAKHDLLALFFALEAEKEHHRTRLHVSK